MFRDYPEVSFLWFFRSNGLTVCIPTWFAAQDGPKTITKFAQYSTQCTKYNGNPTQDGNNDREPVEVCNTFFSICILLYSIPVWKNPIASNN
jgi:hypothetical protein